MQRLHRQQARATCHPPKRDRTLRATQLKKNAGAQPAFFIARGDICNAVFFDGVRKERGFFTAAGRRLGWCGGVASPQIEEEQLMTTLHRPSRRGHWALATLGGVIGVLGAVLLTGGLWLAALGGLVITRLRAWPC